MPISRDVLRRAAAQPGRVALIGPAGSFTYGELAAQARSRAGALPGVPLVVDDAEPVDLLTGLLAADLAGVPAIVVDQNWPGPVRSAALAAAQDAVRRCTHPAGLVVFTSGSTGTPRPVLRSTTSWTHSFPTFSAITGVGADDTVLIPGAMSGSLFLFGAVHALTMGASVRVLRRWSPTDAVQAACACSAVHVVPAMLDTMCAMLDPTAHRLRRAVCAGADLAYDVETAAGKLGIEVTEYYGAAELSVVGYRPAGSPPGRFHPFPGVEVLVEDSVVHARSPYLSASVEHDPRGFATAGDHATAHADGTFTLAGRVAHAIQTGGTTVYAEGVERFLRSLPAVADAVVLGMPHARLGQVVTAVIERAADAPEPQADEAERRSGGLEYPAGEPDRTGPDASPGRRPVGTSLPELRAAAARSLTPPARPRLWYAIDRLPRTGSGKIARAQVLAGLTDGTLPVERLR